MNTRIGFLAPVLAAAAIAGACFASPQYGNRKPSPPAKQAPPATEKEPKQAPDSKPQNEAKFFEKLDKADRDALQANVGYVVPSPEGDLDWIGGDPLMAADFRNKVTVIQVVSSKSGGRAVLEKLVKQLPPDVRVLGLHTPEGADKGKTTFETNPPCEIVIDKSGHWCDALGVWKRAVNIVVDKSGAVRYAGMNDLGLKTKTKELLEEEVDDSIIAKTKPTVVAKPEESADKPTAWPTFSNEIKSESAADMRNRKIPGFVVQKWVTAQPDPAGRLVAIDFWATWCGPCRAAIPHVNELQGRFGTDVLFVGISDETPDKFDQGLQKNKLNPSSFTYSLALDPKSRLKNFFGIKGIPHMAIMSPDGTVRWQGHPGELSVEDVTKLVAANKALSKLPNKDATKRGWVNTTATSSLIRR